MAAIRAQRMEVTAKINAKVLAAQPLHTMGSIDLLAGL